MKCESCSNLMQYYLTPKNSDTDFKSVDKLMKVVDTIYEFRVVEVNHLKSKLEK